MKYNIFLIRNCKVDDSFYVHHPAMLQIQGLLCDQLPDHLEIGCGLTRK